MSQKPGTESGVTYDEVMYIVIVSVSVNDEGGLYTMITLGVEGDANKPERISFTNQRPTPAPTPTATPSQGEPPKTGDDSAPGLWLAVLAASALGLGAIGAGQGRRRRG